jgi:GcrA cell cycle regulator
MTYRGTGKSDWPIERVEQLQVLAAKGLSARQMADKMKMSRNAILGMCYRRGIAIVKQASKPKQRRIRAGVGNARITLNTPRRPRGDPTLVFEAPATQPPQIPIDAPSLSLAVKIMGLKDDSCRFPVSEEPDVNMLYCGAVQQNGCSYCPYHAQLAVRQRMVTV